MGKSVKFGVINGVLAVRSASLGDWHLPGIELSFGPASHKLGKEPVTEHYETTGVFRHGKGQELTKVKAGNILAWAYAGSAVAPRRAGPSKAEENKAALCLHDDAKAEEGHEREEEMMRNTCKRSTAGKLLRTGESLHTPLTDERIVDVVTHH